MPDVKYPSTTNVSSMSVTSKLSKVQKRHKVLVVDDHPIVRCGLAELIAMEPDMEVCGEAADMAEAIKQIEAGCPDVAIIDISLKSGHGLELIAHIKANHASVKMLVSSMHDELLFAERSLRKRLGLHSQTGSHRELARCHPPGIARGSVSDRADGQSLNAQPG